MEESEKTINGVTYFLVDGKWEPLFKLKEELKRHFKLDSGIDLSDYEYAGVFPYFNKKKRKWTSISRGKAWQMYAEWLEDKIV